jgi:hypothetical protein
MAFGRKITAQRSYPRRPFVLFSVSVIDRATDSTDDTDHAARRACPPRVARLTRPAKPKYQRHPIQRRWCFGFAGRVVAPAKAGAAGARLAIGVHPRHPRRFGSDPGDPRPLDRSGGLVAAGLSASSSVSTGV